MNDCNVRHMSLPLDSDMRLVCVKTFGGCYTMKRASYTESWKAWYLAGSDTICKPLYWHYLPEAGPVDED